MGYEFVFSYGHLEEAVRNAHEMVSAAFVRISMINFGMLWQHNKCTGKSPFISYSCISYFGHACLKLNPALFFY